MLCAARDKAKHITAFEIQPSLADIAAKNVDFNHLADKIKIICGDARSAGNEYNGKFDTVFSNPPYLRTGTGLESENESARICRREVTGGIADFPQSPRDFCVSAVALSAFTDRTEWQR